MFFIISLLILGINFITAQELNNQKTAICKPPLSAPKKLEKAIAQCQEDIKFALIKEALDILGETSFKNGTNLRSKRETFSNEERRIAGCLLQCVYRKLKALDQHNFPTATGLVKIYSEGVEDRNYYLATVQGVQRCLASELNNRIQNPALAQSEGYTCDIAYDLFECVSDQIELLCGSTP